MDTPHPQKDCPFCEHKDPATTIFESENIYAIISKNPINSYHVLVFPKDHYQSLIELPSQIAKEIITTVQILSQAVREASHADAITHVTEDEVTEMGFNLQSHFKFHIIPRFKADLQLIDWNPLRVDASDVERAEFAHQIKARIKNKSTAVT